VFGIKHSTFTSLLDRLEKAGLVRREINRDDRRSFLIHLSDDGRRLTERLNQLLETLEADIRGRVSPGHVKGFRAVMGAVEDITRVRLRER
jgi:DNA-binding MarR family transcriptional regulator